MAEAIDGYLARAEVMDLTGQPHRALLSGADLAGWQARVEQPVTLDFMGLTVCKTGPWGQGPVFLQQLALLDGLGLDSLAPGSADHLHTVIECAKLAFADREAWYGDPRFAEVPLDGLLAPGYAAQRRALVGREASMELRPGRPDGQPPRLPGYATGAVRRPAGTSTGRGRADRGGVRGGHRAALGGDRAGRAAAARPATGDTCHLDVADRFGNLVSVTPSGGWLQSSPVIPGLGFCLGTRAQMFTLTEGLPNTLAPGKRPRTTLTPSLALRGGEPYLAFGTPGGDQQDQWTLAFFLNHVVFGMNLQEAIDSPAFHTRHFPSSFYPRQAAPREIDVESRAGRSRDRGTAGPRAPGHRACRRGRWAGSARWPGTAGCCTRRPTRAACRATRSAAGARATGRAETGRAQTGSGQRAGEHRGDRRRGAQPGAARAGPGAGQQGRARGQHEQPEARGQHRRLAAQDGRGLAVAAGRLGQVHGEQVPGERDAEQRGVPGPGRVQRLQREHGRRGGLGPGHPAQRVQRPGAQPGQRPRVAGRVRPRQAGQGQPGDAARQAAGGQHDERGPGRAR